MKYPDGYKYYNLLQENDEILHREFGNGTILKRENDICEIDFNGEIKTMNLKALLEHNQLELNQNRNRS